MRWLAVALLVLPLVACGGTSLNAVANAATKASSAGSEHVELVGSVTAAGQTVKMQGSGDFQAVPKLGAMHLSMAVAGKQFAMDEVMQGSRVYMKSPILSPVSRGKPWVSIDLQKAGTRLGINFNQFTQQDPSDLLSALKKAGTVRKVGSESIDGVDTTHYKVTIDLAKAPNGKQLMRFTKLKFLPADVWVDGQDQLRRMTESYDVLAQGQTVTTSMQMDLSKYGEQVNVQVPSASDTVDMTKLGG